MGHIEIKTNGKKDKVVCFDMAQALQKLTKKK